MTSSSTAGPVAAPPPTVPPDATVQTAARRMADAGARSVAVVGSDDRLAGVLTATDYVRLTAEDVDPADTRVDRYMHEDVVSVAAGGPVEVVAETMAALGVRYVPVTDDGRVVGMVTTGADRSERSADPGRGPAANPD